jgi:hypothetical protein
VRVTKLIRIKKGYQFTTEIPLACLLIWESSILNTPVAAPVVEAAEDILPMNRETEPVVEQKLIQVKWLNPMRASQLARCAISKKSGVWSAKR